jgi:hypothetical protein
MGRMKILMRRRLVLRELMLDGGCPTARAISALVSRLKSLYAGKYHHAFIYGNGILLVNAYSGFLSNDRDNDS